MNEKMKPDRFKLHLFLITAGSLLLGAGFQGVLPIGDFWLGFLAAAACFLFSAVLLYMAWRTSQGGKVVAWMMLAAFLLRAAYGLFLAWGLPRFGYPEPTQQAGFVFTDAFRREQSAWALAGSDQPVTAAFSDAYGADQYGGLLALSALVYRYLSPDAFRPALVSILAACAGALGIPFLVSAIKRRFSSQVVKLSGWMLALYPEGILLGAAQMREPFLILFFTIVLWAASHWLDRQELRREKVWQVLSFAVVGAAGFALFSYRVALPVLGAVLLRVWVVESAQFKRRRIKILGWMIIIIGAAVALILLMDWIGEASRWDALLTVRASGMVQFQLERLPEWLHFPFIVGYGLFQPVLPAAIADSAPWIWRSLGILRGIGWYLLLPLLVYAFIKVWRVESPTKKRWLTVMILVIWAWIFIASARAGGDQWDNPRYRTIFLPWMAITASWGLRYAFKTKDRWLQRALAVEGIFLAFLTYWYISRYYPVVPGMDFLVMAASILVLSTLLLVGGWLRDRQRARNQPADEISD